MAARATTRVNLTDRAKRYRAQDNVTGPKQCVLCGSRSDLGVMHLDGNEDHGEPANLAWGCRSCNQILAAAFKRIGAGRPTNQYNPSKKAIPTFDQYAWAVASGERDYYPNSTRHAAGVHDEAGAIIHATPKHKRIEYAKRIAANKRGRGNPASYRGRSVAELERIRPHVAVRTVDNDWMVRDSGRRELAVLDHALELARKREAKKARGNPGGKRNPAAGSAEVFEEFHGYEPLETIEVAQRVHRHKHLAAAGELVGLEVKSLKGEVRHIEGLGDAMLCFNEKKNQLFIVGGDQSLSAAELKRFGADGGHEVETLGEILGVAYATNKTHLGDEGGEAIYSHTFRTTNEAGRHVTVKLARNPWLIYRTLDQQFEISGGSYTIRAEGIDK